MLCLSPCCVATQVSFLKVTTSCANYSRDGKAAQLDKPCPCKTWVWHTEVDGFRLTLDGGAGAAVSVGSALRRHVSTGACLAGTPRGRTLCRHCDSGSKAQQAHPDRQGGEVGAGAAAGSTTASAAGGAASHHAHQVPAAGPAASVDSAPPQASTVKWASPPEYLYLTLVPGTSRGTVRRVRVVLSAGFCVPLFG